MANEIVDLKDSSGDIQVVAITSGGTGGVTPAEARSNLGLDSVVTAEEVGTGEYEEPLIQISEGGTGARNGIDAYPNLGQSEPVLECKNLLPFDSCVAGGFSFTVDSDGYMTANNASSDGRAWSYANAQSYFTLEAGNYVLYGEAKTSSSHASAAFAIYDSSNNAVVPVASLQNLSTIKRTFTISDDASCAFIVKLYDGAWRFWIQKASITDDTYVPYAMTNRQLTQRRITCDTILDIKSVPTSFTSYSCAWSGYDFLLLCAMYYGNIRVTILEPISDFAISSNGRRPLLADAALAYEIYQNGDSAVYVKANQTQTDYGVKIFGIKLG